MAHLNQMKKQKNKQNSNIFNHSYPHSFKFLINLYQFFGISFGGFNEFHHYPYHHPHQQQRQQFNNQNFIKISTNRYNWFKTFTIGYHLFYIGVVIIQTIVRYRQVRDYYGNTTASTTTPITTTDDDEDGDNNQYLFILVQLKPLLRYVIQSLIYIHIIECFTLLCSNLHAGARLCRTICSIPLFATVDSDTRLAHYLTGGQFGLGLTVRFLVPLWFNWNATIVKFWQQPYHHTPTTTSTESTKSSSWWWVWSSNSKFAYSLFFLLILNFLEFILSTIMPVLMLYTNIIFRKHLHSIQIKISQHWRNKKSIKNKVSIPNRINTNISGVAGVGIVDGNGNGNGNSNGHSGDQTLTRLRDHLNVLAHQYKTILPYYSLSLSMTIFSTVITLIGSICFLIITAPTLDDTHDRHYQPRRQMFSLVLSVVLLCVLNLICVGFAANLVTVVYDELCRELYDQLWRHYRSGWSPRMVIDFADIRGMKEKFCVQYFLQSITLQQTGILSLFGFVLNYVVVLLQTENIDNLVGRDSGRGGTSLNSSSSTLRNR